MKSLPVSLAVVTTCALALAALAQEAKAPADKPKPPEKPPIKALYEGKPAEAAGQALLQQALKAAPGDGWVMVSAGRVFYLSGEKGRGEELFQKAAQAGLDGESLLLVARSYAEGGEWAKAETWIGKALAKDDDPDLLAEAGALYLTYGDRAKGEELLAKVFGRPEADPEMLVKAAGGFLKVRGR